MSPGVLWLDRSGDCRSERCGAGWKRAASRNEIRRLALLR